MTDIAALNLKMEFVKKQACFSQLTGEETEKLAELLVERQFKAGDTIVTEGESVDSVYLIITGTADVRHVTIQNNAPHSESVAQLGPGAAIGLNQTGFYSLSGVRTATVVAITDVTAFRLSMAEFHGFSLAHSHVHEVMRSNTEAVSATGSKF